MYLDLKKYFVYKAKYKFKVDVCSDTSVVFATGKSLILENACAHEQTKLSWICEHCLSEAQQNPVTRRITQTLRKMQFP